MKKKIIIPLIILCLIIYFLIDENNGGMNVSQNGISISKLRDDIFSKYDVDKNNILDVSKESFLRVENKGVIKTESRGLLFTDSDAQGNQDGSVTEMELENFLKQFDKDKDFELTKYKNIFDSIFNGKSEWAGFQKKYGERYKYEEKEVY